MKSIGTFEAKTKLSAVLEDVEAGESYVITKHGRPVATLSPYREASRALTPAEAVQGLRALRQRLGLSSAEIKDLINEGRKY